jgi:hypothetical protein
MYLLYAIDVNGGSAVSAVVWWPTVRQDVRRDERHACLSRRLTMKTATSTPRTCCLRD